MKRFVLIGVLLICLLAACKEDDVPHEHVPDDADCQHVQYCADCGEMLAKQGPHDYPQSPDAEKNGYLFYTCRSCGKIEIVNEEGAPVVPVE